MTEIVRQRGGHPIERCPVEETDHGVLVEAASSALTVSYALRIAQPWESWRSSCAQGYACSRYPARTKVGSLVRPVATDPDEPKVSQCGTTGTASAGGDRYAPIEGQVVRGLGPCVATRVPCLTQASGMR